MSNTDAASRLRSIVAMKKQARGEHVPGVSNHDHPSIPAYQVSWRIVDEFIDQVSSMFSPMMLSRVLWGSILIHHIFLNSPTNTLNNCKHS